MAENDKTKPVDGPVDIDSIPISALFIAKKPQSLNSIKSYLGRRGWTTEYTSAVNEALQIMEAVSFNFVFLSVNSKTPKLEHVPALLSQTFNCTVVLFAEESDAKSSAKLNQTRAQHKLNGVPSGPNVQRKIRSILAAQYGLEEDGSVKKEKQGNKSSKQDDNIEISGGNSKQAGAIRIKGDKKEAMVNKSALAQLKDTLERANGEEPEDKDSDMIVEESVLKRDKAFGYMPTEQSQSESAADAKSKSNKNKSQGLVLAADGDDSTSVIQEGPAQNQHSVKQEGIATKTMSINPQEPRSNESAFDHADDGRTESTLEEGTKAAGGLLAQYSQESETPEAKAELKDAKVHHEWNKIESQNALFELIKNSSVKILNASTPSGKPVSSKIGFQKITSPESGYLVYQSIAENPGSLIGGLCVEINAKGVSQNVKLEELLSFEVSGADLSKAAGEDAKIFFSATKDTHALHSGLFKMDLRTEVPMTSSHNPDKLKIAISSFDVEIPIPCNVYLWLEKNQKMILYLGSGTNLMRDRHARLSASGGYFYFDKKDKDAVEAYLKKVSFLKWLNKASLAGTSKAA